MCSLGLLQGIDTGNHRGILGLTFMGFTDRITSGSKYSLWFNVFGGVL